VVTIDAADYIGRNVDEVAQELRDLGLEVSTERVDNPGDEEADTVADVQPDGDLEEGDQVTVTYWDTAPETEPTSPGTSEPTTPETSLPSAPLTPADQTSTAAGAGSTPAQQPMENGKGNQG
jgi:serine/threonine-protein kinase